MSSCWSHAVLSSSFETLSSSSAVLLPPSLGPCLALFRPGSSASDATGVSAASSACDAAPCASVAAAAAAGAENGAGAAAATAEADAGFSPAHGVVQSAAWYGWVSISSAWASLDSLTAFSFSSSLWLFRALPLLAGEASPCSLCFSSSLSSSSCSFSLSFSVPLGSPAGVLDRPGMAAALLRRGWRPRARAGNGPVLCGHRWLLGPTQKTLSQNA